MKNVDYVKVEPFLIYPFMSHNCLPSNRPREGLVLSLFVLGSCYGCLSFGLSLAFPFCLGCDGSRHRSFYLTTFLVRLGSLYHIHFKVLKQSEQ